MHPVQTYAMYYWCFHYFKRIMETFFVHRFSHATSPVSNVFRNCAYYWTFGAYIAYYCNHPLYTPVSELQMKIGFGFGILCQIANFYCHILLRNLRSPSGNGGYQIPRGFLFNIVTCANYTTEIYQWLGFNIATQTVAGYIFLVVAASIMTNWALGKHRRLKKASTVSFFSCGEVLNNVIIAQIYWYFLFCSCSMARKGGRSILGDGWFFHHSCKELVSARWPHGIESLVWSQCSEVEAFSVPLLFYDLKYLVHNGIPLSYCWTSLWVCIGPVVMVKYNTSFIWYQLIDFLSICPSSSNAIIISFWRLELLSYSVLLSWSLPFSCLTLLPVVLWKTLPEVVDLITKYILASWCTLVLFPFSCFPGWHSHILTCIFCTKNFTREFVISYHCSGRVFKDMFGTKERRTHEQEKHRNKKERKVEKLRNWKHM